MLCIDLAIFVRLEENFTNNINRNLQFIVKVTGFSEYPRKWNNSYINSFAKKTITVLKFEHSSS